MGFERNLSARSARTDGTAVGPKRLTVGSSVSSTDLRLYRGSLQAAATDGGRRNILRIVLSLVYLFLSDIVISARHTSPRPRMPVLLLSPPKSTPLMACPTSDPATV